MSRLRTDPLPTAPRASEAREASRADDRNATIDVVRGLAMLLVIYAHALQVFFADRADGGFSEGAFAQWRLIYSFHMPLFFLISGLANPRLAEKSWASVIKSALVLVLIAFATHVGGFAVAAALGQVDAADAPRKLLLPLLAGKDFSIVVTWFLVALAGAQLFA